MSALGRKQTLSKQITKFTFERPLLALFTNLYDIAECPLTLGKQTLVNDRLILKADVQVEIVTGN